MPGDETMAPNEYWDIGLLASATARPFQTAFGEDVYESLVQKAAALFHSLIANHPFQNGNKRTAVLAVDLFLQANSYFLMICNQEMYELATHTASYRERGVSHDDALRQVTEKLQSAVVSFRTLQRDPLMVGLYEGAIRVRQLVRKHEVNRRLPG